MKKIYLFKSLFLGLFLILATQSKAQIFSATTVSLNNYSGDTCSIFAATVNTYLGCINFTQGNVTKSLSGNTITVQVNYISSPICAGAISNPVFNTNIRRVPAGTYNVIAEAYLDNVFVNSVTAGSQLIVNPCTVTGLEENDNLSFEIFPNPASNFIRVSLANQNAVNYRILDLKGSEIISGNFQNSNQVDVSSLLSGVYFMQIINNFSTVTRKVVIQ